MQDALEDRSAVHLGCLIESRVNAGESRKIDDGSPSCFLPDAACNIDGAECRCFREEVNLCAGNQVDESAGGAQEDAQHTADNHGGNEVRCINHSLNRALQFHETKLVKCKAQNDRYGETPQKTVQAEFHRVPDHSAKCRSPEKAFKPFPANPWASCNAKARVVVAEGNLNTVHGSVLVHNGDNHRYQEQDVQLPVVRKATPEAFAVHPVFGCSRRCHTQSPFDEFHGHLHDTYHELISW